MLNYKITDFYIEHLQGVLDDLVRNNYNEGIIDFDDKKVLILHLEDPLLDKALQTFKLIKKHDNLDGIILYNPSEVIDIEIIKVFYFYCIDNKINHIAIHDPRLNEGNQINFTFDGRNVSMPLIPTTVLGLIINTNTNPDIIENLVSSNTDWKGINKRLQENKLRHDRYYYYTKDNYKSGSERNILFTCYNRQPRANRVLLINEICKQDLYKKGVISCGYHDARFKYYEDLVEEKYIDLFPMQLEDSTIYTNHSINDEVCNQSITNEQLNSFINVISESSSDCNILPLDKDSWTSPFFTEKTAKAFICHNIPLFYATRLYVKQLRDLNFDVFDDFIDHSYDTEINPIRRVEKLTKELKRLCSLPKSELVDIVDGLEYRMKGNMLNLIHYMNDIDVKKSQEFFKFFEGVAKNK